MHYTYSWRDGTQRSARLDPDAVMEAVADDLMADADLESALRRIIRHGWRREGTPATNGTQGLLQQVRAQRREDLERYDLDSMVQDIQARIVDIVATERAGIEQLRSESRAATGVSAYENCRAAASVAGHRAEALDRIPDEPGSAVASLADYDFLSEFARMKFESLMDVLQRQVLQTRFKHMQQSMQALTADDIVCLTEALRALNDLIEQRESLYPLDFERFCEAFGSHFPRSRDLDELLQELSDQAAETEALLSSMAPEMRSALEDSMGSSLRDPQLRNEMSRLHALMEPLAAGRPTARPYPFSGHQSVTFDEALALMRRMQQLDLLEKDLRAAHETASVPLLDPETVRDLLGPEALQSLQALQTLHSMLEEAGYLERDGEVLRLTPRGIRRIGLKALEDIFQGVAWATFGEHSGSGGNPGTHASDNSKPYEFGDPFLLDLSRTLMNAVQRVPQGGALQLSLSDFAVFTTEPVSQAATVLLVDLSRSMPMRGCFAAAKKVALALHTLIRSRFPRDHLYVVGFSDYARELHAESLYRLSMDEFVRGTNIQHGLMASRRLLAGHRSGTRQIILITDGEPTAHLENDRLHFSYPPSARTVQATLREVQRCTREDIIINTFMLERSHYLADFVGQMAKINRGRVFFSTPERLGDYVLVDYVQGRRRAT